MGAGVGRRLAKAALERSSGAVGKVEAIEKGQQKMLMAMRQTFGLVDARLEEFTLTLNAVISLLGREAVEKEVVRLKIEELEDASAKEQVAFAQAITDGKVVKAEIVGDRTIVVGSEVDKDGTQLHPIRVQMFYGTLRPEFKENYTAKHVGDIIDTPLATKFTITELWDIVMPSPEDIAAATAGAALAADPLADGTETAALIQELADAPASADEPVDAKTEESLTDELAAAADGTQSQSN